MLKITKVSPSIIAVDYKSEECLNKNLKKLEESKANFVHLDVMDGVFVPNRTFNHEFVKKVKDRTDLLLDVHLMVDKPERVIDDYIEVGADIITVHYEATEHIESILKKIKDNNILSGVALNPKTPAYKIKDLLRTGLVDVVVVMGVEPGACGQSFIPGSAEKVAEIYDMSRGVEIEIDGGVNIKNAKLLRKLGATIIVSGSAVFNSTDINKAIRLLKGKGFSKLMRGLSKSKSE